MVQSILYSATVFKYMLVLAQPRARKLNECLYSKEAFVLETLQGGTDIYFLQQQDSSYAIDIERFFLKIHSV